MFERYSERARRVVFFARYEASQLGARQIETEHLLLGLLREDPALMKRLLSSDESVQDLRVKIEEQHRIDHLVSSDNCTSTSVEMQLSDDTKWALDFASEEADRVLHDRIDSAHLLLGLLRVTDGAAAKILGSHGLELSAVRLEVLKHSTAGRDAGPTSGRMRKSLGPLVPNEETAKRIAEAVWIPIFGRNVVEGQKPFQTELEVPVWTVRGTVSERGDREQLVARISMLTAEILDIDPLP